MSVKVAARISDVVASSRGQLDQVRAEVDRLRAEIEHEQSRPIPLGTIEERVDATISRLQNFASSLITGGEFIHPSGLPQVGDQLALLPLHPFTVAAVVAPDALKGWFMEKASGALERLPEPVDGPTRAKRVVALETKLRAAEIKEVALSWEMANEGLDPGWRGDISPELVLGLENAA
jgi:hypothetical protein